MATIISRASNAATEVFNIPELLELVLLALPCDTTHQEMSAMRMIYLGQSTCRTWQALLKDSMPIRERVYLATPMSIQDSTVWYERTAFPPARPSPWIPNLLLNQRSWGSAWPFDDIFSIYNDGPSEPRHWTFSFEISRMQYSRLPPPGTWRNMLACDPPFTDLWYTRCFYELGSGRAPFVTHVDYNAKLPKSEQKYRKHCANGVTLGDICDAVSELFDKHTNAKFVLVENVRCSGATTLNQDRHDVSELLERPKEKLHLPGSSAHVEYSWQ